MDGLAKVKKPWWREWLEALIVAIIATVIITTFIGGSYVVQGSSMEKTLIDGDRIIVEKVSYRFGEPKRGDIIALKVPGNIFIKRIIAVGGDTVEERNGIVFVNGEQVEEEYVTNRSFFNWGPVRVPEGHVWVMGDNRPVSNDSRGTVGFVPHKDIIGRAIFRYWPLNKIGSI